MTSAIDGLQAVLDGDPDIERSLENVEDVIGAFRSTIAALSAVDPPPDFAQDHIEYVRLIDQVAVHLSNLLAGARKATAGTLQAEALNEMIKATVVLAGTMEQHGRLVSEEFSQMANPVSAEECRALTQ